jgi:hypothetical protein
MAIFLAVDWKVKQYPAELSFKISLCTLSLCCDKMLLKTLSECC